MINIISILVQREKSLSELTTKNDKVLFSQNIKMKDTTCDSMREFRGGAGGSADPFFWRILQKIYEKYTEMNVQMPFFGPQFPEFNWGRCFPFLSFLNPPLDCSMQLWNNYLTVEAKVKNICRCSNALLNYSEPEGARVKVSPLLFVFTFGVLNFPNFARLQSLNSDCTWVLK